MAGLSSLSTSIIVDTMVIVTPIELLRLVGRFGGSHILFSAELSPRLIGRFGGSHILFSPGLSTAVLFHLQLSCFAVDAGRPSAHVLNGADLALIRWLLESIGLRALSCTIDTVNCCEKLAFMKSDRAHVLNVILEPLF